MRPLPLLLAASMMTAAMMGRGEAAPCGDDVGGRRVGCRCGDTVVSDTILRSDDAIVNTRCPLDGLVVRAATDASSIRLDLGGLQLRGSGVGTGIEVKYGGTDGAQIIGASVGSHGVVLGFGVGLSSTWREAIARVSRLELRGNRHDGARLAIAGTILDDVVARANRGNGLYVRGTGGRLIAVRSYDNFENGIRLFTSGAVVDALVHDNGRSGIIADGRNNDLSKVRALDNMRDGVVSRNSPRRASVSKSEGNGRKDVVLSGLPGKPAGGAR